MDAALASRLLQVLGPENKPQLLIEHYPRIAERVAQMWGRETLVVFLNELLFDTRGDREGFPPDVAHELFTIQREHDRVMGIGSEAAIWGYEEAVRTESAIHLNEFDLPAYLEAAKRGRLEVLREQLQGGAHVDSPDGDGLTAFWWAVFYGHFDAAELLLQNGARAHAANSEGQQAAHLFAAGDHSNGLNLLLRFGVRLNVSDHHGFTPLMAAAAKGRVGAVALLLEQGLIVNEQDQQGKTALHYAAEAGHRRVIELLLSHGADARTLDLRGQSAYELAMLHPDSAKIKPLFDL
ncbi:ankyrin repeat domain-containing protein [Deefgea rivuli]|uniref:ankyrin repeat domain-containing protein n=1 Tax=Deefgea rivuli TaxID=400948 RepID=UPI0004851FF5|nr:ankyrin repeat domain-containing protein [Deefgea rivuli]